MCVWVEYVETLVIRMTVLVLNCTAQYTRKCRKTVDGKDVWGILLIVNNTTGCLTWKSEELLQEDVDWIASSPKETSGGLYSAR